MRFPRISRIRTDKPAGRGGHGRDAAEDGDVRRVGAGGPGGAELAGARSRSEVPPAGLHRVAAAAEQPSRSAPAGRFALERSRRVEARAGRVDPAEEILRGRPAEALDPRILVLGQIGHQPEAALVERRRGDRLVGRRRCRSGRNQAGREQHAFHAALGKRQRCTRVARNG